MTRDDSTWGVPCPSDLKRNQNIFVTGASEQLIPKTFALILERSPPAERVTNQSDPRGRLAVPTLPSTPPAEPARGHPSQLRSFRGILVSARFIGTPFWVNYENIVSFY